MTDRRAAEFRRELVGSWFTAFGVVAVLAVLMTVVGLVENPGAVFRPPGAALVDWRWDRLFETAWSWWWPAAPLAALALTLVHLWRWRAALRAWR